MIVLICVIPHRHLIHMTGYANHTGTNLKEGSKMKKFSVSFSVATVAFLFLAACDPVDSNSGSNTAVSDQDVHISPNPGPNAAPAKKKK